jgi:hypothetical protein
MAAVPNTVILLLAAWLFDFQSSGAGEGIDIQAYFIGTYVFALAMFLIGDRHTGQRIHGLPALMVCGAVFLGVGIVSALINGQETYPILRNGTSVFIYLSAAYVMARTALTTDPAKLRFVLSLLCLFYSLSAYFIYDFLSGGVDLEAVRFQIIGASAIAALGYLTLAVLFKLTRIEQAAMLANGVIVLLSITRSFLLAVLVQGSVFAGRIRQVFQTRLIVLGGVGAFVLLAVLSFGQSQLLRWEGRMAGTGSAYTEYETLYTRLSEWEFMLRAWTSSIGHFLFGTGIASRTSYHTAFSRSGGTEFMIGFGHNMHLSMPFVGGVIGGLPLLFLQWFQAYLAWRFLRQTIASPKLRNDAVFLGAWGATIILGFAAINTVSAAFTTRGVSLWFGIGTGLLLGIQARFDPANIGRSAPVAMPRTARYQPA